MNKSEEVFKKSLFFYKYSSDLKSKTDSLIKIELFKPTVMRLNSHTEKLLIYIFWYLVTLGRYTIYYVKNDDGKIIHYSHVLPKFFKFPFMKKGDLEIGPCWTHENFRGRRIYPNVLKYIINSNFRMNRSFYIIIDYKNIASQKGTEKVGFTLFAKGYKTKWLGIYRPIEII